jgi:uncharacterized protein (DUF2141 family)
LVNCARVGTPTGGPKDELPPVTISAEPDFGSTYFKGNKIKISFDEYIKFKDLNKQLIISPPLKNQPDITPLGIASKYISIKILDTLKKNTTYTFNFGNAIVDNAEGNPLEQFKYVISTGSYVDSLEVKGTIAHAFEKDSPKDVLIMLYELNENFNDSIIYNQKPDYVTNTMDSTFYNLTHLKQGKFLLLALQDLNSNMTFEPKIESIGFLDEAIHTPSDTTYHLRLFKEQTPFNITKLIENKKGSLWLGYEGKWQGGIENLIDETGKEVEFITYPSPSKDSINIWYKKAVNDSLFVQYKGNKTEKYGVKLRAKEVDSLSVNINPTQTLHPRDSVFIYATNPIQKVNKEFIKITQKDSTQVDFSVDELKNPNILQLNFERTSENRYQITVLPGAITDFFDVQNDTLVSTLNTKKTETYGEIKLKINSNKSLIITLLDNKDHIVQVDYINESKEIHYTSLLPDSYKIRIVKDENNNGQWDTGNYLSRTQPEEVIYYSKVLELRANWTLSEQIKIE